MTFPETLHAYRRRAGLSMGETARRAEFSVSLVSRYESGDRHPAPAAVSALASALDLDTGERIRLYLSAGYVPSWVRQDERLLDLLTATIVLREPRRRTVKVERRAVA